MMADDVTVGWLPLPEKNHCIYTPCFCEENVWKLCEYIQTQTDSHCDSHELKLNTCECKKKSSHHQSNQSPVSTDSKHSKHHQSDKSPISTDSKHSKHHQSDKSPVTTDSKHSKHHQSEKSPFSTDSKHSKHSRKSKQRELTPSPPESTKFSDECDSSSSSCQLLPKLTPKSKHKSKDIETSPAREIIPKHIRNQTILSNAYVVFISNADKTIPIWNQKAGTLPGAPVVWDYHVVLVYVHPRQGSLVYDLDTLLPFPCPLQDYVVNALKSEHLLKREYHRLFRVVPGDTYLRTFASNRQHMLHKDSNEYMACPPHYPPIRTPECDNNLQEFIRMEGGHGTVMDMMTFVHTFQS